jgi:hypothetical protein
MARQRDYRAEYARRIAHGLKRGLSRSQARGHPTPREPLAADVGRPMEPGERYDPRLEFGLREMLRGRSLKEAATEAHVAPERLRNYFAGSEFAHKEHGRWAFRKDRIRRRMLIYTGGKARAIEVLGSEPASLIGRYMNAVKAFLRTNDPGMLAPFRGNRVTAVRGRTFVLETRPNVLYRLDIAGEDTFEQVYRIVV